MRAMILAAGLGTRLRPLTLVRPKVLVPLRGVTVLDFWLWQLHHAGFEAVVANACHLHEALLAFAGKKTIPLPVEVRVERGLLGTAEGIRNVLDFFDDEPFAVVNGDIICDAPMQELYRAHLSSGSLVSLLLHDCPEFNNVAVSREGLVVGFGREALHAAEKSPDVRLLAFTGIHFIHPSILRGLPPGQFEEIVPLYRDLIRKGRPPRAILQPGLYWREMGSLESYRRLHEELSRLDENSLPPLPTGQAVWVHSGARVAPGARMQGYTIVGEGCRLMEGVSIENTVLWDHVCVKEGASLRGCIVTDGAVVEGEHTDEILIGKEL